MDADKSVLDSNEKRYISLHRAIAFSTFPSSDILTWLNSARENDFA
jgi:hypothetical protein